MFETFKSLNGRLKFKKKTTDGTLYELVKKIKLKTKLKKSWIHSNLIEWALLIITQSLQYLDILLKLFTSFFQLPTIALF